MSDIQYFTEEGLRKLKDELEHLKSVERPKIIQQIAEARDKGDLSENAEYDAAKEAQGHLEDRINKLEAINGNARVVDTSKLDVSVVRLLTKVTIKNTANSMEMTYSIVPEAEANLRSKKISVSSPIGKGLLGKSIGEIAEIQIPNGIIKFEVVKIEAA
ncbi:MAG: transcription elongation factor GreA [Flavobacteriales bacterium]|jgi:transcription elongation factor GreA|nr:transcription elongation factor GreA [Flavobacteriales bacterium]MBT6816059.1 transcription elongation factor GreA [Flavobacteriales bacterium]MBT7619683.1 transcription elongation factor GreA [Flavobacteriales bacterium]MBT7726450.1 transcription elongation factor GreA [Flavobacteriales bacterium]MDG2059338.1 transcription elongation factor GreA [Flavobacteriales bacterium]